MTDFIHEHPAAQPSAPPREDPPLDEKTGEKRVYGYIFILFVVAFGLLLWTFFMNQHSNDQVLSELRGNADALQTAITRNIELEREADALEERVETLEQEKEALEQSAAELSETREMLESHVRSLTVCQTVSSALLLMNDGEHEQAAGLLASRYGTADYEQALEENDNASRNDAEPPIALRERYDAMLDQLVMEGYLTVAEDGTLNSWHPAAD